MKRLTPKDLMELLNMPENGDTTRFLLYAKRLWDIKNEFESGEFVKLPCKVGDKAWYVTDMDECSEIIETVVKSIEIFNDRIAVSAENTCRYLVFDIISGKVFNNYNLYLNKTDAEARLKQFLEENQEK